ncbi:MAG: RluA family pseudouridine synthase [Planctomycetota bacterium]|nr:RluA family pseudouridine synthase [Planctomycetota bacterium]
MTSIDPDRRKALVPAHGDAMRLDRFLADCFPIYSRRQLATVVKAGHVRVNGVRARPGQVLHTGDRLELPVWSKVLPTIQKQREAVREVSRPESEVVELHRDDDLLIVAKPPGVAVHGGAGQGFERTLIDLMREDVLAGFGLVHRLDKGTTGAIALVRGDELRRQTMELFQDPDAGIQKTYDAIVSGEPDPAEGTIDAPLAAPGHGGQARVDEARGKPARTHYRTLETFPRAARLELDLETGRTHQIRVHLASIGCPLLVDPLYAGRKGWRIPDPRGSRDAYLKRTPLHARRLALPHPRTGETVSVEAPLPADMKYALEVLRVVAARGRKRGGLPPTEGT